MISMDLSVPSQHQKEELQQVDTNQSQYIPTYPREETQMI